MIFGERNNKNDSGSGAALSVALSKNSEWEAMSMEYVGLFKEMKVFQGTLKVVGLREPRAKSAAAAAEEETAMANHSHLYQDLYVHGYYMVLKPI